jgi:hypothetical protein
LGLDHTQVEGSTMESEIAGGYSGRLISLEPDDGDGLCSIYPPEPQDDPEEVDLSGDVELKKVSTCQFNAATGSRNTSSWMWLLGAPLAAFAARKRHASRPGWVS